MIRRLARLKLLTGITLSLDMTNPKFRKLLKLFLRRFLNLMQRVTKLPSGSARWSMLKGEMLSSQWVLPVRGASLGILVTRMLLD